MDDHLYILIMAGGEGTRFYPLSTPERPKQFLSFWGDRTFIQQTFDRISDMVPASNIYVATNKKYVGLVKSQLPDIPMKNIIGEPRKRNTAPCIAYAARIISEGDKDAVMVVLPSDHMISKEREFRKVIDRAVYIATTRDVLVTLGIQPTWAADCYGYIKMGRMIEDDPDGKWHAHIVDSFIEKPSVAKAQGYVSEGSYVWNSGMFIWKAAFILKEIEAHLPQIKPLLDRYVKKSQIRRFFHEVEPISIDYGVMERSDRVVTVPCSIGWTDIGTWQSLYNLARSARIELEPHVEKVMEEQLGM